MMLWRVWGYQRVVNLELRPEHEIIFTHLKLVSAKPVDTVARDKLAFVVAVGAQVLALWDHALGVMRLLGAVMLNLCGQRRPAASSAWTQPRPPPDRCSRPISML